MAPWPRRHRARRKGRFFRPCWRTSPSRCSTATSRRPGRRGRTTSVRVTGPKADPAYRMIRYRGRLRRAGTRHPGPSPGAQGADGRVHARADALDALARENADHPRRRRLRPARVPHRAEAQARATSPVAYRFPSKRAVREVMHRIKALTRRTTTNLSLEELIHVLNPVLRGWANYHRHGASKRCFAYLSYYLWWRVVRWLRKKYPRLTWKQIRRRYWRRTGPASTAQGSPGPPRSR